MGRVTSDTRLTRLGQVSKGQQSLHPGRVASMLPHPVRSICLALLQKPDSGPVASTSSRLSPKGIEIQQPVSSFCNPGLTPSSFTQEEQKRKSGEDEIFQKS
ncbi:hypothetical protein AAHA92_22002 [Salvia divinorum]|uniref:Uncharacterized protein n=1 Tax=Salvia divinorum TaxID=28513 RepID=A0ABD1GM90_SALDI